MATSAARASSGSFHAYTCSSPRNSVPTVHQPEARQTRISYSKHVALLSPRMQGFYRTNPTPLRLDSRASEARIKRAGSPEERAGGDKTIIAQSSGSGTFGPISNQQFAAASLLPVVEPHYAGLIAIMMGFAGMIYWALYKFAGFVGQAAGTIPQEGGSESIGEGRDSGKGSKVENVKASAGIRMGKDGVDCSTFGRN